MEDSGIETVCSFSAGTYESWRPDVADHPDEVLGMTWDAWAERLIGRLDFAITEECLADGWCADMAPYRADGKPILDAEYADRGSLDAAICVQAEELGVSVLSADRELTTNLGRCG